MPEATTQETPENPPENDGGEAEKKFWAEHETRTRGVLDKWFDEKWKEIRGTGTSRGGEHSSFPKMLARIMGGPFDPTKESGK